MKRYNWRHFFGGVSLLLILVQLLSGLVLTMFYTPHLKEAYASIQAIYSQLDVVAWIRDAHRWTAFFLMVTILLHFIRSFIRQDYLNREKKTFWLTGVLLFLPMLAFLLTGFILPWEWRAYWFMEMVPNYVGSIAIIGPALQDFLINAFTMNRNFVAHVVVLPIITVVLLELHSVARIRKRSGGIPGYIMRHGMVTIPFLLVISFMAYYLPMPSQDPDIIPMPLDGEYIPTPEWFSLVFFLPYMHFKGFLATFLSFYLPFLVFLLLAVFPYYLRWRSKRPASSDVKGNGIFSKLGRGISRIAALSHQTKLAAFISIALVSMILFGGMYAGTYKSPTMGCNSCHNIYSGNRMGVPPEAFKDRQKLPLLGDSRWMMEHWFYPQVVW